MQKIEKMRAFIIQFLFYCLIIGLVYAVLKYAMPVLTPFLVGFLIAFFLKPLINWITEKTNLKRKTVSVLVLLVFYIVIAALITILGAKLVVFLRDAFDALPGMYTSTIEPGLFTLQNKLEEIFANLNPTLIEFINSAGESITASLSELVTAVSKGALGLVTNLASSVPSFFVKFLMTIIVSFFCVVDYYQITSFLLRQLPQNARKMMFKIKDKGVDVLFQFGKAYAILLSMTFGELWIGFLLLGVDYAFLVALAVAVVDILPILGTGTVLIPWGVICLISGEIPMGAGLFILYAIITVVRQSFEPRIVGKQIGLYPLVTLICMFTGAYLFGFLGLFGLPIAATILVQLNRSEDFHLFK